MAYLSKAATSLLGACVLIVALSIPVLAAMHTPITRATSHASTQESGKIKEDAFLHILTIANRMVLARYPQAQFYEAEGTPRNGRGMTERGVIQWLFVFNDPSTTPNSTINLQFQDGHLGRIQHISSPFLEDQVIKLPLRTGLHEAVKLLRKYYDTPFTAVTVRFPLVLKETEPYYIFSLSDVHLNVFVGVYSHKISTEATS